MKLPRGRALAGTLALVSVAGLGATYLLMFSPDPAPVEQVDLGDPAPTAARQGGPGPIGLWVVGEGSEAGYVIPKKAARFTAPAKSGKTTSLTGDFTVTQDDGRYHVRDIRVDINLSRLTATGDGEAALPIQGLETDRFPMATFLSQGPLEMSDELTGGGRTEFQLEGALTIHGVTRHVSIPVEAQLSGKRIEVAGSLTFPMADFGIELSDTADGPNATLDFHIVLGKAA